MLGMSLIPTLLTAGHDVFVTDVDLSDPMPWGKSGPCIEHLDVRSSAELDDAVDAVRPDLVAYLAAVTDLEECERNPDHAFHVNAIGTKSAAGACKRRDIPMAYISTAGIFDGEKDGAYVESDEPNPLMVYGHSKLEGERYVSTLLERYYIIRVGWMMGGGKKDHKFVARVLAQLSAGAKVIRAVGDKFGSPTYSRDLSRCFVALIETELYGLYHVAGRGRASRHDVAREILYITGCSDVELEEVTSDAFSEEFFAPRPRSEVMDNAALETQGLNTMRRWEVTLREYLETDVAQHNGRTRRH